MSQIYFCKDFVPFPFSKIDRADCWKNYSGRKISFIEDFNTRKICYYIFCDKFCGCQCKSNLVLSMGFIFMQMAKVWRAPTPQVYPAANPRFKYTVQYIYIYFVAWGGSKQFSKRVHFGVVNVLRLARLAAWRDSPTRLLTSCFFHHSNRPIGPWTDQSHFANGQFLYIKKMYTVITI